MKKYFTAFIFLFLFTKIACAQTATFITLDNNGNLYRVTISSGSCNYTPLNFCTASMGGNLPLSIALNGTTLYTVDNKGNLYSATLGASNCSKIGAFSFNTASKNTIYGLTVDKNGLLYAASGGEISTFNPATSVVTKLPGKLPSGYTVGGDIIFYLGQLYMPTKTDELIQVNLSNLATSTVYLNFSSPQIFGISSVSVPCSNNQVYALSTPSGSGTTDIIALDMQGKAEGGSVCQLPFETYDAASIAESGAYIPPNLVTHDQSICAPGTIDLTAPAVTAGSTSDIISFSYWKNALATIPYTTPTVATNGTYYIIGATVSGCADTNKVVVTVNAVPTISTQPSTAAQTVCKNGTINALSITATAGSGTISSYHWYSNSSASASGGTLIATATSFSYTPPSTTVGTLYYYSILTNSNGCSDTSNVSGAINIVTKPNAGNDQPLCLNKTATMNAAGTGTWTPFPANPAVTSITNTSLTNTTISGFTIPGNYIFIWGNGACTDTTQINVSPVARSTTQLTICETKLPYTWNGKLFAAATKDSVQLVSSVNCDSIATLILTTAPVARSLTKLTVCEKQLPYTWNGIIFSAAKTEDSVKLTSTANCDSIATLILTITATARSSTQLTICETQLPFTWNGKLFTIAKKDSVQLTSAANCDSIATLILTVTPIARSSTDLTVCPAQMPYTWNGILFTVAKTDSTKLTSSANCDSIATLVLSVNSTVRSTTKKTICETQFPYTWNGIVFTNAKTDSAHFISSANCDSIAILILTVNPIVRSTTKKTICETQLPYTWNGIVFTKANTDSAKLISATNCDSIATLILTVNPIVRSTTKQTICETQLPYTWNGIVFTKANTDSAKLISAANCDSIATLLLTVNPTVRSITNLTICETELPFIWNNKSFAKAKNDSVTLISNSGCDSIATLILAVSPTVRSISYTTICPIDLPYHWNDQLFTTAKTDSVHLISSTHCDSVATLVLTVTPSARSTTKQTICETLLPYTWNNKIFTVAKTDSVQFASSAGCDSIAILILTVTPVATPVTDFSYSPNSTCLAGANPLLAKATGFTAGGQYTATPAGLTIDKNTGVITVASSLPNTYTITYNVPAGNCSTQKSSSSPFTINSAIIPVTSFSYSTPVCNTSNSISPILATGFTNGGIFSSTNGLSLDAISGVINLFSSTPDTYTVTYTINPTSCIVKGSHTSSIKIDASSENNIITDACSSYTWNNITYTNSGIYVQNFTNTAGCDSTVTLHLTVVPNCFGTDIYFPSAFSPNGDGVNDYFGPLGNPTLVKNYQLRIYNRFGELVFHTTNPYEKWDGSYLGAITAPNNYVWYADFLLNGTPKKMKGNLIIIK